MVSSTSQSKNVLVNLNSSSLDSRRAVGLQYQPALAMSCGRLMLWLVLTADSLFLIGVASRYAVRRQSVSSVNWLRPTDVHLESSLVVAGGLVLIGSSAALAMALRASRRDRPSVARRWMALTLGLGMAFLGLKTQEYRTVGTDNLLSSGLRGTIYDQADFDYVSAVTRRLTHLALEIGAEGVRQNELAALLQDLPDELRRNSPELRREFQRLEREEQARGQRLAVTNLLLRDAAQWTSHMVGSGATPATQRMAMRALAHDVYRTAAGASVSERYIRWEAAELKRMVHEHQADHDRWTSLVADATESMNVAQAENDRLSEEQTKLVEELAASADDQATLQQRGRQEIEADLSQVREQLTASQERFGAAATAATEAEQGLATASGAIQRAENRQTFRREMAEASAGLNQRYTKFENWVPDTYGDEAFP